MRPGLCKQPALLAFVLLLWCIAPTEKTLAQTPFSAGTGITGAWYNPARDGEGFLVEILSGDHALVTWFTYDLNGRQLWLIGNGSIDQNVLRVDELVRTSGPAFGSAFDPAQLASSSWGSLGLIFSDCNSAQVQYSGPAEFGSGSINLVRLTGLRHAPCDDQRPFLLGFTAFPFEASTAGVDEAFRIIRENADLVTLHNDNGLPWIEALASDGSGIDSYPEAWRADWQGKRDRLPPGHRLLLAITPIAISRDRLAPYNDGTTTQELASLGTPWAGADFSDPDIILAYTRHAMNSVAYFRPDYLLVGIEVNLLQKQAPELWPSYVAMQQQVYAALKERFPSLPVLLSFSALEMLDGLTEVDTAAQRQSLRQVEPLTDLFGMSLYPFLTALLTDPVPEDLFSRLADLSTLPYAVTETGYYSEFREFSFGNGSRLTVDGSPSKQQDWIERLLREAERRQYRFVVNFIGRDYDALCAQVQCSDVDRLWEAAGLVDEKGADKPAMSIWRSYLRRPLRH